MVVKMDVSAETFLLKDGAFLGPLVEEVNIMEIRNVTFPQVALYVGAPALEEVSVAELSVQVHLGLALLEAPLQARLSVELVEELAQLLADVAHSAEINFLTKDSALVAPLVEAVTPIGALEAGSPATAFQEGVLALADRAFTETSEQGATERISMVVQGVLEEALLGLVPLAATAVLILAALLQDSDSRWA